MTKQTGIPTNIYNRLAEANQLRLDNRLKEALIVYQSCIGRFGRSAELLAIIAHLYFKFALSNANETGDNYEKAIQYVTDALTLEPANAALHTLLAEVYTLGPLSYELAAQEYRRALEINPYCVSTLLGAASLYGLPEKVVMLDEAITWLEQAIKLDPNNPHLHIRLGNLYQQAEQPLAAQRAWLKSLLCLQPLESDYVQSVRNSLND